ncbi:MAG: ABC transporter ATP-binding protein, partial [Chloroflexi bacterium]
MTAVIQIEDAWKTYRVRDQDVDALAGVDLAVGPGEWLAVCG